MQYKFRKTIFTFLLLFVPMSMLSQNITIKPPTKNKKEVNKENKEVKVERKKQRQQVETDEQKYEKAVASNNNAVLKDLATHGFIKSYAKVASIYLKEDNYALADKYARLVVKDYGKYSKEDDNEAWQVLNILKGFGYYDNGEHGGEPFYPHYTGGEG